MTEARFPFSAVVGHDDVKLALLLNAVDPRIGGVLLRGEKGSAKSTLARGLAALLPGDAPFVELPVGATEDRLVGTLDLEAALTGGRRRLHPGLLHAADGGVLYVDEVNLLPDHLVDVLLDVAASGVNRVEREGVSETHPSRFVLIGSMNPEEGELRPQLLDRFGLSVEVASSADPGSRAEAVRRRLAFDADPAGFAARFAAANAALAERLAASRAAALDDDLLVTVSRLCAAVGAEGLRADLVTSRAAAALAGWEGRSVATVEEVRRVAHLALAHRRRRTPFEEPGIDRSDIDDALSPPEAGGPDTGADGAAGDGPDGSPPPAAAGDGPDGSHEPGVDGAVDTEAEAPAPLQEDAGPRQHPADRPAAAPGDPYRVARLAAPRSSGEAPSGRRSAAQGPRGRLVKDRAPTGPGGPVAVGATVRTAAARRAADPGDEGPLVRPEDLREAVREQKTGNLIVLAVDASGSMGAERRMEAVKGAVLSLLVDAYQRRDRVALVTFRGDEAAVALRPTGSVEVARARLADLPTGGRTPLAAGIHAALGVAAAPGTPHRPLLVLVSDGRATSPTADDAMGAALTAAAEVRRRRIAALVVDAEDGPVRLGLAGLLAEAMGARCLTLPELSAGRLAGALRAEVGA